MNSHGFHAIPPEGNASEEPRQSRMVLVLDMDPGVRWALEKGLTASGYDVRSVSNVGDALRAAQTDDIGVIILEMLPEAGLTVDVLGTLLETPCAPRIVCTSIDAAPQTVVECIRRGASDFVLKPFGMTDIRNALKRVLQPNEDERPFLRTQRPAALDPSGSFLIGISQSMQELRETIAQVAQTDLNCLLRGESGTGKDMAAREIHRLSRRSDKPFVKVNCTALPEHLLESELFGYEKGAFTGAASSKPGRFELAHRGVIFLDEIGDMHPNLQAKLLQVIEHKEFMKLGGRRSVQVDVQIIAATNADLEQRTKEGVFRGDLYFRLNELSIWVPPLSSRKEDVPLLVRHFLQKHGRFGSGHQLEVTGEDFAALTAYPWPGNVRELESTIKRWLALGVKHPPGTSGNHALPRVPAAVPVPSPPPAPAAMNGRAFSASEDSDEVDELERILSALEEHQWNRRKAAETLGISYQTLRRRIEKYGLDRQG
ncbi:MAG TPA: sigma-54 dependent transcriptional regulator [Candidatus Hydrogenedentes bacterium]|nr:sigma-54 dependent transcriptional regulator [Candidatus Hydrogenedentota bacterium]